mmetsp:Transcript_4915/g.11701  ORF Transcript_4915/g.11701 Transcript_4915/m.11701 type:complete len:80 (+) Transcript_4915:1165-1404(+)
MCLSHSLRISGRTVHCKLSAKSEFFLVDDVVDMVKLWVVGEIKSTRTNALRMIDLENKENILAVGADCKCDDGKRFSKS